MAVSVLDTVASQLETVLPEITDIYVNSDQLYGKVKPTTKAERISRYLLRWALRRWGGGNFQKVSGDAGTGGSLGAGTAQKHMYLLSGYFYSSIIFRLTEEQIETSDRSVVENLLANQQAIGIVSQQHYDDVTFHTNGNGILTNSSSATNGTTTLTFAAATDTLGVNLLFEGMTVGVWDSTGATERAAATAAPIVIISIDHEAKVVTFDQTVTGLTQGDIISLRNMAVYGPSSLTSFASTYPGTQGSTSATGGIGGDSFRHGFKYFTDTTSSNYFFGQLKSAIPQLNPVRVNASNDQLQWEHGLRLVAKIKQKRPDKEMWKNITGIAHGTQKARVFEMGMAISQKFIGTEFGQSVDLVPSNQANSDEFNFAGIRHIESTRQDRGTIDYVNFNLLGRAEAQPLQPFGRGGVTLHQGRGSDGTLQTYVEWAYTIAYDNIATENGAFGRIDSLSGPSSDWDA